MPEYGNMWPLPNIPHNGEGMSMGKWVGAWEDWTQKNEAMGFGFNDLVKIAQAAGEIYPKNLIASHAMKDILFPDADMGYTYDLAARQKQRPVSYSDPSLGMMPWEDMDPSEIARADSFQGWRNDPKNEKLIEQFGGSAMNAWMAATHGNGFRVAPTGGIDSGITGGPGGSGAGGGTGAGQPDVTGFNPIYPDHPTETDLGTVPTNRTPGGPQPVQPSPTRGANTGGPQPMQHVGNSPVAAQALLNSLTSVGSPVLMQGTQSAMGAPATDGTGFGVRLPVGGTAPGSFSPPSFRVQPDPGQRPEPGGIPKATPKPIGWQPGPKPRQPGGPSVRLDNGHGGLYTGFGR